MHMRPCCEYANQITLSYKPKLFILAGIAADYGRESAVKSGARICAASVYIIKAGFLSP